MITLSPDGFLWAKYWHIISVICWMAGIFYLPRLYVYHASVPAKSARSDTFKIMERKLYRGIMLPALVGTIISGTLLVLDQVDPFEFWVLGKIFLGLLMVVYHFVLAHWRRVFARDENKHSHVFYRYANEVPTILMFFIVYLAFFKPLSF